MNYQENLHNLLKITQYNPNKNKITLRFNDEYKLLPFQTREPNRPKYQYGFKKIISEFSRIISSVEIDKNFTSMSLLDQILSNEKIEKNKEDESDLKALLKDYLLDQSNELNIVHPLLYKYMTPTSDISNKGEKDIAQFFRDVFFKDVNDISDYFNSSELNDHSNNNILTKLIIDNLPELNENHVKKKYITKLDYVTSVFNEDISFALKNDDFLNKNIENIFAYYYFFYTTQLSLKINFEDKPSLDICEKVYYLLDTENASKNRRTINMGYDRIKSNNKTLLYKIYTMDYVNKLLNTKGLTYTELIEYVNNLEQKEYSEFIHYFKEFIQIYNKTTDKFGEINEDKFENLFIYFYNRLLDIKDQSPNSRFIGYFEDIGKKYFFKRRGRYSNVLNLSQDMLLTITALCVKEDKIKLKNLFKEYERRGIFFDNSSKKEVEHLLSKLNYIDKKSDSGEAQYVRRLL